MTLSDQSRRHGEVESGGDLEGQRVAIDNEHVPPDLLNEPGVVGRGAPVGVGVLKHLAQETLWGLYAAQRPAIGSRLHAKMGVDHLDGIGHCQARHDGGVTCAHGADHPGEQIRGCETPGRVMNQDDAVVRMQRGEPSPHRGSPIGSPCDDLHPWVISGDVGGLPKVGRGGNDDHMSDFGATQNAPERVSQQRLTAQRYECLGRPGTKPYSVASSDDDDDDRHDAMKPTASRWHNVM